METRIFINLFTNRKEGIAPLKGYVCKPMKQHRKHFTTDIFAPVEDLRKFGCRGQAMRRNINPRLVGDVARLFCCVKSVAFLAESRGEFDTMGSKEFSDRVRELYHARTKAEAEGRAEPTTEKTRHRIRNTTRGKVMELLEEYVAAATPQPEEVDGRRKRCPGLPGWN